MTLCDPMACSPQTPLSMGVSRQEYQSGLPCPVTMPRCNTDDRRSEADFESSSCAPALFAHFCPPLTFFFLRIIYFFAHSMQNLGF